MALKDWKKIWNKSPISIEWKHPKSGKVLEVYWSGSGYSVLLEDKTGKLLFRSKIYKTEKQALKFAKDYMRRH